MSYLLVYEATNKTSLFIFKILFNGRRVGRLFFILHRIGIWKRHLVVLHSIVFLWQFYRLLFYCYNVLFRFLFCLFCIFVFFGYVRRGWCSFWIGGSLIYAGLL